MEEIFITPDKHAYYEKIAASFLYFAYGSNLLTERLRRRCPSCRFAGIAEAHGYELVFSKISKDKSGKATIIPSCGADTMVTGASFDVHREDLPNLDKAEGLGFGYDRDDNFAVRRIHGADDETTATYLAPDVHRDSNLQPYDWYLALVIAGAREHGFPAEYLRQLEAIPSITDPKKNRRSRLEAINVLQAADADALTAMIT